MRYRTIVGISARLGLLLLMAMAAGPVHGQNQTPANVAPPASVPPLVNAGAIRAALPPTSVATPAWLSLAWKDPSTGLMWPLKDNGAPITQANALKYCRSLTLGGFKDWRLPEIDELAQIYDASVVSGSCSVDGNSYDLHLKGGIQMTEVGGWSATRGNHSGQAWFFGFTVGLRYSHFVGGYGRALCVRRAGE